MSNYADGKFESRYGTIHVHNPGSLHTPENIQTYAQGPNRYVRLQGPALRAFKAAEKRVGKPILITGVGYRSFEVQRDLFYGPENDYGKGTRFANPHGSMHVEALAVDVDQGQSFLRRRKIKRALEAEGWHYSIPSEPWHASYRLKG